MKSLLVSLCTAALLVAAILIGGQSLNPATVLAVGFAASLAAWTLAECNRGPRPGLRLSPPRAPLLRPGLPSARPPACAPARRVA